MIMKDGVLGGINPRKDLTIQNNLIVLRNTNILSNLNI